MKERRVCLFPKPVLGPEVADIGAGTSVYTTITRSQQLPPLPLHSAPTIAATRPVELTRVQEYRDCC